MNDFLFQDEQELPDTVVDNKPEKFWRILVVDDDTTIHQVTNLVLSDVEIESRRLDIVSAYSSEEAKEILKQNNDFCMAFVDVVMETDHAGLELVEWIRNDLKNQVIRLILRTGQAGRAPEASVIKNFDINDYKEKTDFTSNKMITSVYAGIRAYRDIMTIQRSLDAFKQLIVSTHTLLKINEIKSFGSAALNQLLTLMDVDSSALYIARSQLDYDDVNNNLILACTGKYVCESDNLENANINANVKTKIKAAFLNKESFSNSDYFVGYYQTDDDSSSVLYIEFEEDNQHFRDHLLDLFANNVALILEGLSKQHEIERTQKELLYAVGEAVENNHKGEKSHHLRRISALCGIIANKLGLSDRFVEIIQLASILHDIGKIPVSTDILNKPGKLTSEEWLEMKTHASYGNDLLSTATTKISKLAANLAHYHHENWNGSGYPDGLAGEDIPIEARIVAVADVFDALGSKLCYKEAWNNQEIKTYFLEQRGKKFQPELVDLVVANFDELLAVRQDLPDSD
jgi:response regulator RpfG family c-di-GMP phosphodiesterase